MRSHLNKSLLLDWVEIDPLSTGHMEAQWRDTKLTVYKVDNLWDGCIRFGQLIYKPKVKSPILDYTQSSLEDALFNLLSGKSFPDISLDTTICHD